VVLGHIQRGLDYAKVPPVQIYLGNISGSELVLGFVKQLIWIAVLLIFGFMLWNKGKKKLVVQGG
jgi:ABC-2 type transport system permease protein